MHIKYAFLKFATMHRQYKLHWSMLRSENYICINKSVSLAECLE